MMFETSFSISILLGLFIPILIYFLFIYKSKATRLLEKFPNPPHHPIFGIIPTFLKLEKTEILAALCEWGKTYGSAYKLGSVFGTTVILSESSSVEKMLTSQTNLGKGSDYDYVRPWLGDGLLLSTGRKWTNRRRLLTPAFHFKILEDFIQIFNKEAEKMVEILKVNCKDGKEFDICHYVSRCTLDIICETAMGQTINAQEQTENPYIKAIYEFGNMMQYRSIRPWLKYELIWKLSSKYRRQNPTLKILHGFTESVIKERKKNFLLEKSFPSQKSSEMIESEANEEKENIYFKKKKRLAFLDLLLEAQLEKGEKELSDKDLREETDTFMFEGHDTTSTNMSFILYALAAYPTIQAKAHKELEEIFGSDKSRQITTKDLSEMKYLECIIKETLRVYPSVPFIQRKLTSDLEIDNGRIIPEGITVGLNIFQIHRDSKKFPEPELFRPERFIEGDMKDPFAFVPFSAGPRNCIGQKFAMMEEKVVIATVLRHFTLSTDVKPKDLKIIGEMVLRSENGLHIKINQK